MPFPFTANVCLQNSDFALIIFTWWKICSKKFRFTSRESMWFINWPQVFERILFPSRFGYKGSAFSKFTTLHVTEEFSWSIWQCRTKNYSVTKKPFIVKTSQCVTVVRYFVLFTVFRFYMSTVFPSWHETFDCNISRHFWTLLPTLTKIFLPALPKSSDAGK